jgi:hypothetical protein
MITITIRRYNNKLLTIMNDNEVLYQGEPTDYVVVYNEEVPPAGETVEEKK